MIVSSTERSHASKHAICWTKAVSVATFSVRRTGNEQQATQTAWPAYWNSSNIILCRKFHQCERSEPQFPLNFSANIIHFLKFHQCERSEPLFPNDFCLQFCTSRRDSGRLINIYIYYIYYLYIIYILIILAALDPKIVRGPKVHGYDF
jgi:hypothetical protein